MCTGYLLSRPCSRGEQCLHQYLQTPRAAQQHGQHSQPLLCASILQKTQLRWTRPQWLGLGQPSILSSSLLMCGWSLFSPLLSLFPYCFFPGACKSHHFLPLPTVTPLFSCIAPSFLSRKVYLFKFLKAS